MLKIHFQQHSSYLLTHCICTVLFFNSISTLLQIMVCTYQSESIHHEYLVILLLKFIHIFQGMLIYLIVLAHQNLEFMLVYTNA